MQTVQTNNASGYYPVSYTHLDVYKRQVVVLPKGTNTDLMTCHTKSFDDKLLTAKNKWLIAHEEAGIEGAVCGLKGENIDIAK